MVKAGYSPGFSAALSSTSAIIGPIIPPSIPMVLYGVVSDTSIGYLFMGGVIPGLLLAAGAGRASSPSSPAPATSRSSRRRRLRQAARITLDSRCRSLTLPAILLGGIYSGAVTPTEAAAVAAFCALMLAFFWYRTLSLGQFYDVLVELRAVDRHGGDHHRRGAGDELGRRRRADPRRRWAPG